MIFSMDSSPHPVLLLKPEEARAIHAWIDSNRYSFDDGHFELVYDFWIFGPEIRIHWKPASGEQGTWLELRAGDGRDEGSGTLDRLEICGRLVPLEMPPALRAQWLGLAAARTEAEVNADCEPSGSSVILQIDQRRTRVLIKGSWVDLPDTM